MIEIKDTNQFSEIKKAPDEKETKAAKENIHSLFDSERREKNTEVKEDRRKSKDLKSDKINLLRYPIIGAALVILAAAFLFLALMTKTSVEQQYHQHLESLANKELSVLMNQASQSIRNKTQTFISILNNSKAVPFESPQQLEKLINKLKTSLNDSLSVQLIPANYSDDEIIDTPGMGYTFLFLLNELKGMKNTATANFTMIELYKGNEKGKKLLLVHKVMNNEETIAYVIARLSTEFMTNLVTKFDARNSYFEIIQQHGTTVFKLVKKGNTELKSLDIVVTKKLDDTPWKFKYWSAEQKKNQPIAQFSIAIMYFIFALLAVFIALILGVVAFKKYCILHPVIVLAKQEKKKEKKKEESFLSKLTTVDDKKRAVPKISEAMRNTADNIFRAYDIRGIVGDDINTEIFRKISAVIVQDLHKKEQKKIAIACDNRSSSPQLMAAVIETLLKGGIDVIDVGMVISSSILYFAAMNKADGNGVMITASHNPRNYNGMKIMIAGHYYCESDFQTMKQQFLLHDNTEDTETIQEKPANKLEANIIEDYLSYICQDVKLSRPLKVVLDTTDRMTGKLNTILFKQLSCDVINLNDNDDMDSTIDCSHTESMNQLAKSVLELKADIGFRIDGDRLDVIASDGQIIWVDRILMLLGKEVLSRNSSATILYDVKSTKNLRGFIKSLGGNALMCKTGHSFIKNKLQETNALLAGEMSGHIYFKDRWFGFDDANYAAARILEILSIDLRKSGHVFAEFPNAMNTPEIFIETKDPITIMKKISKDKSSFDGGEIIIIDGLRVEYPDGWGFVRASKTSEHLTLRFEADNETALQRIANAFKTSIKSAAPDLELPF